MFLSDRTKRPDDTSVEGAGGHDHCAGGRRQGLAGQHTDTPTDWRPPRGLRDLAAVPVVGGRAWPGNTQTPPTDWRPPRGLRGLAAVPVGDGRARAGLEIDHSERSSRVAISRAGRRPPAHTAARPIKAGHAAAGDQAGQQTTSAKTARGRAAAHRHTQRPGPPARGTPGATSAARTCAERNPYSPRNALIAGISRTACTRPAR